jgi:HNH endonuclease
MTRLVTRVKTVYDFKCDECNTVFQRDRGRLASSKLATLPNARHICHRCVQTDRSLNRLHTIKERRRQETVGAVRLAPHTGYLEEYIGPNYPFKTDRQRFKSYHWERQHIVVMERVLGRALEQGEVVHHIDGNKQNNDPTNLDVMTVEEHNACHGRLANELMFELVNKGIVKYDRATHTYFSV